MDKQEQINLIFGEKYYSINDLRYNQKVGIMFSKDEFQQFLKTKEQLIDENFELIKKLPLKTFNSKHCFYVNGKYLLGAENEYLKLKSKVALLKSDGELSDGDFENYTNSFTSAITEDLNTANAITVIYSLLKDDTVNDKTKLEIIRSFDKVLALDLLPKEKKLREDHEEIMKLIEQRNEAKKDKDFELADSIRDSLYEKGIKLIDTREGTTYTEV